MKLTYLFNCRDPRTGVAKKVINQCRYLRENGMDAEIIFVGQSNRSKMKYECIQTKLKSNINFGHAKCIFPGFRRQISYYLTLRGLLKSPNVDDIVYLRYPGPILNFLLLSSPRNRVCKLIYEHNTIERTEYQLSRNLLYLLLDIFFGASVSRNADGIVGVTEEITNYQLKRSGNPNKPHLTIGNGISLDEVPIRRPPDFDGKELNLVFAANVSRWHGLDRLLRGLALYKGRTKIRLFIAGTDGKELQNLRIIANSLMLTDNITFTGFVSGISLDHLFDITHIAIGTLGMHRKNMKEGSTLKAREYCARGIPFLDGCHDPDFSNDFPYILKVPADESSINIDDLIRFARNVYSDPQHHMKMRIYAENNLDWSTKMLKLKVFCESLFVE